MTPAGWPPGAVPMGAAKAAAAVWDGATTVRHVAKRCHWRSLSIAHGHLCVARRLGLVTWENGLAGTLRPGVQVVANG